MECTIHPNQSPTTLTFTCKQQSQKSLIDILLKYSPLSLSDLPALLNLPIEQIKEVSLGNKYFTAADADHLALLLLMCFSH